MELLQSFPKPSIYFSLLISFNYAASLVNGDAVFTDGPFVTTVNSKEVVGWFDPGFVFSIITE